MEAVSMNDLLAQISVGLDAVEAEIVGATPYHSKRVAMVCLYAGRLLGYDNAQLLTLGGCALLHDNALTQYILSERPNPNQQLNCRMHCELGEENRKFVPFPTNADGLIQYHHECADGSGVFGLREGEFPEEAGIIALADQLDVQLHLQKLPPSQLERARDFIRQRTGTCFSSRISEAVLEVLDESLLAQCANDQIHSSLRNALPEISFVLTPRQLLELSGLAAKIIDYKSKFTREHTVQIANKAWYLGGLYGYTTEEQAKLYQAAALHDVGKLFIPTSILEKPGKLTTEEFRIIQSHALHSWEILLPIRGFEQIAVWACNHHEKLNGTGYPYRKKADELDFNSRLLTCLDIYQAVREIRPYHEGRTHEETMKILFDMVRQGLVDGDICKDLDRYLRDLPNGNAPCPILPS